MAKPTTSVLFSNSSDIDGEPIWNDISSYVVSVDISRGKSSELDSYSSGTVAIVLNNRSRAFEPNYVSSPFYGLIEPFGKVQVVSAGFTEFVGVIDTWSFGYSENGVYATAEIRANDNLAVLAKNVLTTNTFTAQLSGSRVRSILYGTDVYYSEPSCIDTGTRTITDDAVVDGEPVLDYLQKVATNDGAVLFARRDGILAYQDTNLGVTTALPTFRYNYACNSNFEVAIAGFWAGGVRSTNWSYQGTNSYASSSFSPSIQYVETNATKYLSNTSYNISFYIKNGTAASKTINLKAGMTNAGNPNSDSFSSTSITLSANEVRRVDLGSFNSQLTTDGIGLTVDHFPLTTANAFYIDCVLIEKTTKLNKYFDGSSAISAPSGQTYTFSFEGTANNSTSIWQTVVDALVDFSVVTSVTDKNYSGIKFNDVAMAYASEKLYNNILVNGGFESTASDLVSQSKYGMKEYAITDCLLDNQADNDSLAKFLLSLYRSPDFRAEVISINLHNLNATDQNTILAMDMLSQINLKFVPGNAGAALSGNYQVIGINQNITTEDYVVQLRVTSLDNFGFILDHPTLGILDTSRLV